MPWTRSTPVCINCGSGRHPRARGGYCSRCWSLVKVTAEEDSGDQSAIEAAQKMLERVAFHGRVIRGEVPIDATMIALQFSRLRQVPGLKHLARYLGSTSRESLTPLFADDQLRRLYEWLSELTFYVELSELERLSFRATLASPTM
jgi:hypothetical protein